MLTQQNTVVSDTFSTNFLPDHHLSAPIYVGHDHDQMSPKVRVFVTATCHTCYLSHPTPVQMK